MAPPNHTSFNGSTVAGDSMNSMSISSSFEHVNHEEINKILQALESLLNQAKTPQCKDSLERLRSFFNKAYDAHSNSLCLNEIYKNLIESLSKEPDLDHAALYEVLGLNKKQAELDDFSNLADLIKGQIAGFSEQKLLEMCTFSKISYGNVDRKLEKGKYKTKRQFEEEGYQIIKFYDNELIEDKYCLDTDYKLEQHDVGYALTGSNSYNRDAGYVFIKKEREKKEEITISYHGTRDLNDVKEDLRASLAKLSFLPEDHRVHSGFYSLFRCSWPSVHKILQGHANDQGLEIKDLKINVTGHSMGGALANIAALCLNKTEDAKDVHVATFGSPRVFYNSAAEVYNECLGSKTIRVACQSDPVPCLPHGNAGMHYKHVGKLLKLGTGNTLECLQPHYHKIDTYYNLIQKVQQENFKSDNNPSKYRHIAYIFGLFYHAVLSYVDVDDEGFFKKVEEENKDIKLSEIPIEYAPKLEERFKQGKQEVAKLTNEKTQLEERLHIIQQSLDEKIEELRKLEQECKSANKKLIQEQQETSKFRDQVDKLTKTLQEREGQLTEENRALCVCVEKLKVQLEQNETELKKKIEELNSTRQELNSQTNRITELTAKIKRLENTKTELEEEVKSAKKALVDAQVQLKESKRGLDIARKNVSQLEEDLKQAQQDLATKTKEFKNAKIQLEKLEQNLADKTSDNIQQELDGKTRKLDETKAQLEQERNSAKQELDVRTQELESKKTQIAEKDREIGKLNGQVTQLTEEKSQLEKKLENELDARTKEFKNTKAQLEQERDSAKQDLAKRTGEITTLTKELKETKAKLEQKNSSLVSQVEELEGKLEEIKTKLAEKGEELRSKIEEVTKLNGTIEELEKTNAGLRKKINNLTSQVGKLSEEKSALDSQFAEKERVLNSKIGKLEDQLKKQTEELAAAQAEFEAEKVKSKGELTKRNEVLENTQAQLEQEIKTLTNQVAQLNNNKNSLENQLEGQLRSAQDQLTDKESEISSLKGQITQLAKEKDQLAEQLNDTRQNPNPDNENKKLLAVSAQSRKQVTYASVSFVLSGTLAVGASLTIPYLVICIALAVAALTFLAVGCYCSYKVNTALSNVEVKNGVDPASVEV